MTNLKKNVPELRFPEFSGEWEEKKIKQLFKVVSGSTPLRSNSNYYENGNVPWVKTTDLNNTIITQTSEKVTEEAVQKLKLKLLPKNTLLIAMYGGFNQIGRTGVLKIQATTNQAISALLEMGDTNSKFFQAYLNFNVKKWHRVAASSRKDPNITKKDIENFKIPNTSIKEQNKISDFFVKLDRQIELEEQKLTLLEEQKKGYMQKIFSQELRFKDDNGNDYPEWTISKLGDLGTTFSGLSSKDKEDFGHGDAKFITYMNVFKNNIAKQKLTEKVNVKNNEKQNLVEYGDVLFTTSSEVPHEVGMSSVWLYEENVYLNSFCFGFRLNVNYINSVYLSRVLRSQKMRKMITILAQGSTRFNISKKELMKLNIDIPSMEEQHKIIDFISNMDQLIEKQFHKVDLLKQRKQGFLQKMFV